MSILEEKNIPQQNLPMNYSNTFSYVFLCILGGYSNSRRIWLLAKSIRYSY